MIEDRDRHPYSISSDFTESDTQVSIYEAANLTKINMLPDTFRGYGESHWETEMVVEDRLQRFQHRTKRKSNKGFVFGGAAILAAVGLIGFSFLSQPKVPPPPSSPSLVDVAKNPNSVMFPRNYKP